VVGAEIPRVVDVEFVNIPANVAFGYTQAEIPVRGSYCKISMYE